MMMKQENTGDIKSSINIIMKHFLLILSALLLAASCKKEVALDAMEESQVVVAC